MQNATIVTALMLTDGVFFLHDNDVQRLAGEKQFIGHRQTDDTASDYSDGFHCQILTLLGDFPIILNHATSPTPNCQ
jgi:hypothetical protein